jgi:hypothetical protein
MPNIAGVDGCRAGWIALIECTETRSITARVFLTFRDLVTALDAIVIAIDIPIGLTDSGARQCDHLARRHLGSKRGSSVFPAPIRPALAASPSRICGIRDLIAQHRPRIVIFYGLNARGTWSALGGGEFVKSENDSFAFHSTHSTLYIMTKHPTAFGATNAEFEAIGRFAAAYNITPERH